MKKNRQKDSEKNRRSDDERALRGELGSFGLEPPKIYRRDQKPATFGEETVESRKNRNPFDARRNREGIGVTPQEKRRSQNKRRQMSKLKRNIIFGTALSLAIISIIIVLSLTVLFKIQTITIEGSTHYEDNEILAVLPISVNDNLFTADKEAAAEKLKLNLPYIYSVNIKRKLPSKLIVTVTETPRIYSVKNDNKTFTLLDADFKVLETSALKSKKGIIKIQKAKLVSAVPGQPAEFDDERVESNLLRLASTISTLDLNEITSIYTEDINNNYMVYDSRITFKLGTLDHLEQKIYSCLSACEKLNESNPGVKGTMTATSDKQTYFTAE